MSTKPGPDATPGENVVYYKEKIDYLKTWEIKRAEKLREKDESDQKEAQVAQARADKAREYSRANKQGDWYGIMMAMLDTMMTQGKAMHASSSTRQIELSVSRVIRRLVGGTVGAMSDRLSWHFCRVKTAIGLKDKPLSLEVSFDIKIGKDGQYTSEALINGVIPVRQYLRESDQTPLSPELANVATEFEDKFQEGFEAWLHTKGCSINQGRILDANNKPLTQKDLMNLNQGPGNLSEFLSTYTGMKIQADPNDLPDATPTPLTSTPKPK